MTIIRIAYYLPDGRQQKTIRNIVRCVRINDYIDSTTTTTLENKQLKEHSLPKAQHCYLKIKKKVFATTSRTQMRKKSWSAPQMANNESHPPTSFI